MELIHRTLLKKMNPKKGYIAPYIRFAWNTNRALIGKPVSIYKVDGGYFISTESNEFKLLNLKKVESEITKIRNNEFKPNEKLNTSAQKAETIRKNGPEGI